MLGKTFRSFVAVILAVCLVFSSVGTVFATGVTPDAKDEGELVYVSLGDSMTNGYGLSGYNEGNVGVNGYLQDDTNAYPVQFAKYLAESTGKEVEHIQLAISCMRAEDLRFALELDYADPAVVEFVKRIHNADLDFATIEEEWTSLIGVGDKFTYDEFVDGRFDDWDDAGHTGYDTLDYAEMFQTSIADADVITIGNGNANFGVFLLHRIVDAVGIFGSNPDSYEWIKFEDALDDVDAETKAYLVQLYNELKAKVPADAPEMVDSIVELIAYTAASYMTNYKGALDRIAELNEGADIMIVGLMNTMAGVVLEFYATDEEGNAVLDGEGNRVVVDKMDLGGYMETVIKSMNNYLAGLPTVLQAIEDETYVDHTFLIAEAEGLTKADMIYDELETAANAKWIGYEIVRDRIVTEYNDTVYGMIAGMFNGIVKDYGLSLEKVSVANVTEYETFADAWEDDSATATTTLSNNQILSCAVYLAFEQATVTGSTLDALDANAFMTLANGIDGVFNGVAGALMGEGGLDMETIAEEVEGAVTLDVASQKEAIKVDVTNAYKEWANTEEGTSAITTWANTNDGWAAIQAYMGESGEKDVNAAAGTVYANSEAGKAKIDELTQKVIAKYAAKSTAFYTARYVAADITAPLANALTSDSTLLGLFNLFARFLVGNGIGCHPSQTGHDKLAAEVIATYAEQYTVQEETKENLITAAGIVKDLVVEYYDEAYAYAYAKAAEEGYIDTAIDGIDSVIATLENIDLSKSQMTDEFKAELAGEIEEVIETLNTAKVLIDTADVLDQATLDALIATLDEAGEAVENLQNLLAQAGEDVNDLIVTPALNKAYDKLVNEVIPAAKEAVNKILTDAYNYLVEKLDETGKALKEAYDAFVKAAVEAVKETAPEVADWIYDWLYNNPEKVIAFFAEYGDDMVAFLDEYKEEAAAVIAYLVANFGDEVAEFVMDNADEILTTMVEWLEVHGENTWELILVYLQELGVIDAINEAGKDIQATLDKLAGLVDQYMPQLKEQMEAIIDEYIDDLKTAANELMDLIKEELQKYAEEVKPEIEAAIKDLQNQLDELKQELADKKAELENAADELKAEIQKAIDELEAKIAEVEAAIAELEAKLAELAEKLEAVYEAALGLDEAIEKLIAEGVDAAMEELQNALTNVAEAIKEAIAVVSEEAAEKFREIADTILNALEELYDGATSDKYIVAKDSYYVALGDGTAVSESYVDMLAEELGLSDRYVNLAQDGDLFADIYDVLAENTAEIEKADLVTVGYGSNSFINYAIDNVLKGVMTGNVTQPDWTTYVGEEGLPQVEEALAEVKAYFDEQNLGSISVLGKTVDMAELMTAIVESYAYAAASYACDLPEVINAIHEINPDAVVIIVGMYNPLEGIEIQMGETSINVGKYVDYLVEAANVHNFAYALLTDNAIFVEAEDVETQNEKTVMTVDEFLGMYLDLYGEFSGEALNPSEAGHKYIQEQILDALTVRSAFEIEFARLQLGNSLAMDFAFKQDVIAADDEYYVQVTKTYNDGRADKVVKYTQDEWKTAEISGTDYYYVRFTGVAAKEMADDVYVQVFTADGKAASEVYTCSIRDYAMRAIKPENNDETNALYVDMLNYGAAAQDYFDYNADDLANNELTAEQKEYATDSISVTNNLVKGENYNASALDLANSLKLKLRFDNIDSSMYAVVSFTNHLGREIEETIDGSQFQSNGTVVVVDQIVAADACEMITCTVYDSEGNAVATVQDSVESYIARTVHGHEVYTAVMKFTIAAHNYFH